MKVLVMIKPDAFPRRQEIELLLDANFKIIDKVTFTMTRDFAEEHYQEHKGKPFFEELINFITSGPCESLIVEGHGVRDFCVELRKVFGASVTKNAMHCSDSAEAGLREINLHFGFRNEIM